MAADTTRIKEIFLGAADLPDAAARAAFLDRACGGDAGLRERVTALLASHDPDSTFLDAPADCEAQLKAGSKLKDFSRIPRSTQPARAGAGQWKRVAAAALLLPVLAPAATEIAGVTHLFRVQQATTNPSKPIDEPTPINAAKQHPLPATFTNTLGMEFVRVPKVRGGSWFDDPPLCRAKIRLACVWAEFRPALLSPKRRRRLTRSHRWRSHHPPTVHDTWIKAVALLALDELAAALPWLRELNPAFDGEVTAKIERGVLTSLDVPSPLKQDLTPLRTLTGLRRLTGRSTLGYDNQAARDAAMLQALETLEL